MAKKKKPFIKKNLRPDLEIDPDKKLGELTVRDLTSILGYDESSMARRAGDFVPPIFKNYWDYNKMCKDHGLAESPSSRLPIVPPTHKFQDRPRSAPDFEDALENIIKKISGLENEIKKLKKN